MDMCLPIPSKRKKADSQHPQRGSTAIEFAVVFGPLIFFLSCILETGIMFLGQFQLLHGVQQAAREIWLGNVTDEGGTPLTGQSMQTMKDAICSGAVLPACATRLRLQVVSADNFTLINPAAPLALAADGAFSPGGRNQVGVVVVSYDWRFISPATTIFANVAGNSSVRRLGESAAYRNQF